MNTVFFIRKNILGIWQGNLGRVLLLASLLSITAMAQSMGTPTSGTTPTGLSPGKPAGSFPLSDFDIVNLYNGNLNFSLPLLQIGGRGRDRAAVKLTIDPTKWQVRQLDLSENGGSNPVYIPRPDWWSGLRPGYGPGVLQGRRMSEQELCIVHFCCPAILQVKKMVSRLTFTNSDGTEFELRDLQTGGQPLTLTNVNGNGQSRGNVFISADGTAMTFVSDTTIYDIASITPTGCSGIGGFDNLFVPSGFLHFADGTVYRIDNGLVSWSRDRNGNKLHYSYDSFSRVVRIIDQLNHEVIITYGGLHSPVPYDDILYKGFGGAQRRIRVWRAQLSQALRQGLPRVTYQELFPTLNAPSGYYDTSVVSAVELPDGRRYQFYYNNYAELARVELPTGGAFEYDYTPVSSSIISRGGVGAAKAIYRRVVERRVYPDGVTLEGKTLFNATLFDASITDTEVVVDQRDPNGVLLARNKHYFFGNPGLSLLPILGTAVDYYSTWKEGKEYRTEKFNALGNALRRNANTWEQRAPVSWWTSTADSAPPNDPRVVETAITLLDTNQVAKTQFTYDQYNNRTAVLEYDFGSGGAVPLLRQTQTNYLTLQNGFDYAGDANLHLRRLPTVQTVRDAASNIISQTTYEYDNYTADANHAALVDRPAISGMDANFTTGYQPRGNITAIRQWLDTSSAWISTYKQYDIAGNIVKTIDPRGAPTTFNYSDGFGAPDGDVRSNVGAPELGGQIAYAFPTKVTNAVGHEAFTQYDYYLGAPVDVEDVNGIISSIYYNDTLDRPSQTIRAVNASSNKNQSTFTYGDANRIITITADQNTYGDNRLKSEILYDGLGRTVESRKYENVTTYIRSYTEYDARGLPHRVSNPHRPGESIAWTKTSYDSFGRATDVETPDGARVITQYSGSQMTVIDQAGKTHRSETDALERLIKVIEDPNGLNYVTNYSYDALGNLRVVTQRSQTRTFGYNSLSQLISATNPESGSMTYAYDPNGNLIEKTDARGVRTTMTYDPLNRIRSKVYTGITPEGTVVANATPRGGYFYDDYSVLPSGAPKWLGTPSKGRLIGVTYGNGSDGTYFKYDSVGRIVTNHQRMTTSNYATTYTYDLASSVTREHRGNRSRNLWTYDDAGRLSSMQTSFNPFLSYVYLVKDISYTSFGAVQSETYGNGLIHSMGYNNRLQPTEIRLGTPGNLESVFRINYIFGTAHDVNGQDPEITLAQNNGNVARIKYFISGTLQYSQTFQYDPVNRLRYAVEHNNGTYNDGARAWYQTFDYDPHGNRGINVDYTSDNMDATNAALKLADFSAANNRITRLGYAYDAAGNLTEEPGKNYTYNAENKIVTATVAGGGTSQYGYDGNGHRVKKIVAGVVTRFEYSAEGKLIAERNEANGAVIKEYFYKGGELLATTTTGTTYEYATADHLGSPRAWTDNSGNLVVGGRHDYLPFGEELFAGYGVRTTDQGYAANTQADGQRKQFGLYERDSETGLDFAGARYFGSSLGRFASPDDFLNDTHPSDPQSWNLYVYVRNNPLKYIDPDGQIRRDSRGNVIFDVTGTGTVKFKEDVPILDADRRPTGYTETITWEAEIGYVYADDGTPIEATRATGPMKVVVKGADGTVNAAVSSARTEAYARAGFNPTTDCHGNSFASGQVWINDDQVGKILSGDGYSRLSQDESPEVNDVGIYSEPGVGIKHSVLVNSIENYNGHFIRDHYNPHLVEVTSVISKGGITPKTVTRPGPGPGTGWHNPTAQLVYYRQRLHLRR